MSGASHQCNRSKDTFATLRSTIFIVDRTTNRYLRQVTRSSSAAPNSSSLHTDFPEGFRPTIERQNISPLGVLGTSRALYPGNYRLRGLRTFRQGRSQVSWGWRFFLSGIQGTLYMNNHPHGLGEPGPLCSPAPGDIFSLSCSKYRNFIIRFLHSTDIPLHIVYGLIPFYR